MSKTTEMLEIFLRGHVTGSFTGGGIHNSLSRSKDLAKLNPKCHMNYSNYL